MENCSSEIWYDFTDDRLKGMYQYSNKNRVRFSGEPVLVRHKKVGDIIPYNEKYDCWSFKLKDGKFKVFKHSQIIKYMLEPGTELEPLDKSEAKPNPHPKIHFKKYNKNVKIGNNGSVYINKTRLKVKSQEPFRIWYEYGRLENVDPKIMELIGEPTEICSYPGNSISYANGWYLRYDKTSNDVDRYIIDRVLERMDMVELYNMHPVYVEAFLSDLMIEVNYVFQERKRATSSLCLRIAPYDGEALSFTVGRRKSMLEIREPLSNKNSMDLADTDWVASRQVYSTTKLNDRIGNSEDWERKREFMETNIIRSLPKGTLGNGWTLMYKPGLVAKCNPLERSIIGYMEALVSGMEKQPNHMDMFSIIRDGLKSILPVFPVNETARMSLEKSEGRIIDIGSRFTLRVYCKEDRVFPAAMLTSPSPEHGFRHSSTIHQDLILGDGTKIEAYFKALDGFDGILKDMYEGKPGVYRVKDAKTIASKKIRQNCIILPKYLADSD